MNRLAADIQIAPDDGFSLPGFFTTAITAPATFERALSIGIGVLSIVASIWFIFNIVTSAIAIIGSSGDKAALEGARKKITYSFIGLIVIVSALALTSLLGRVLGIPNILNIRQAIDNLR